jgi:beta-lactam-binding protein with PASTA domain
VRVCPNCRRENSDESDFCEECNAYLRWEPTVLAPSVPGGKSGAAPSAPAPPPVDVPERPPGQVAQRLPVIKEGQTFAAPAAESPPVAHTRPLQAVPELVQITLRLPGDEGAGGAFAVLGVDPGGQAIVRALVRNQSGIVDNYELTIEGMPAEWWTIAPSTVYLVPFGAPGGEYEQEVEIRLHPPRSPDAEARMWSLRVVATSKAHETEAGIATITATIAPYQEFETEVRPEYARGRRRGNFAVAVRNRANAPSEFTFSAVDSGNACRFKFAEPTVTAPPGKRAGSVFRAVPRKQIWIGRPVERRFQVSAAVPGSPAPPVARPAVFRQKPWIARWVPIVLPVVVGAAAAVFLLLPHNATVPNIRGRTVFAAKKLLEAKGLALGDVTVSERTTPNRHRVGKIKDQSKPPGAKVKKGMAISVQVWSGTQTAKVPDLKTMSLNEAKGALERVKLVVGKETPEPADPDKAKIVSQSPAAETLVKEGTPIDLFFPAVAEGTSTGTSTGGATTSGATTSGTGTTPVKLQKGALKVPDLTGLLGAAAATQLSTLGLGVQRSGAISTSKAGTIVGQTPDPGTPVAPGTPIQVFVSVGFPRIAFDDGLDVKVMDGADGKHLRAFAATPDAENEPSWQPGGTLLAYRRGSPTDDHVGSIGILDTKNPLTTSRMLTQGPNDRRPAFAPNGKVLAFIRGAAGGAGNKQLCFVAITPRAKVTCATANADVDRPAWSADGRAILTVATDTVGQQNELFLFTSAKPFSSNGADWSPQGLVTDSMHGKRAYESVIYAAFSPDGKQVALAANWGAKDLTVFSVFLAPWTPAGLGKPKPLTPTVRACDVAWRSDSKELAVTQMDDCSRKTGDIVRFDPANPSAATTVRVGAGADPAWQPVDLATR